MPVRNARLTLVSAIDSILKQTLLDIELIIIDDHSTDNSLKLIETRKGNRIRLFNNNGEGIADALNTGLSHAQGRYIARMDADDISHPARLEKQHDFIVNHPNIDVVSCRVKHIVHGHDSQEGYAKHVDWINSMISSEDHYSNRFTDAVVAHPSVFFKASLINKYGNYSSATLPEDFEP